MAREELTEIRYLARLAWNNWPDTEEARKKIAEHEARDDFSARAWDRVVEAMLVYSIRTLTNVGNEMIQPTLDALEADAISRKASRP